MREKNENFPEELFLIENDNKNYSQLFKKMISGNIFLPDIPDFGRIYKKGQIVESIWPLSDRNSAIHGEMCFQIRKKIILPVFYGVLPIGDNASW